MSKDLEREYRALVHSETPDLWARIEAGIDELDRNKRDVNNYRNDMAGDMELSDKDRQSGSAIRKIFSVRVWATVAAACVCVGLIVPVMRSRMSGGSRSDYSAAPQNSYTASPAEAYDTTAAGEAKSADTAAVTNGVDASAYDNGSSSTNAAAAEGAAYDGVGADEVFEAEAAADEADAFQAAVEITDIDVRMDSQIVYKARVLYSENPDLQEDSEIQIASPVAADDNVYLEQGMTYELILSRDNSWEEPVYWIVNESHNE